MIDEAGARIRLKSMVRPPDLKDLDGEIEELNAAKEEAVANQDFEKAASLRDQADKLKQKKEEATEEWKEQSQQTDGVVDEDVIAEVVAKMTGIPLTRLSSEDAVRLLAMEDELHETVVSQAEAVTRVSKAIRRSRSGLKDPKRPTGIFLFAGPTGVGKTLLAKTLADFLFGEDDALIQLDMSEYMEKHNVSRLIGAPPGYVGYEEGGQLTEKIRRRPYAVVLLDEIEKAHPDVFNMLLQIMEEGHLTDSFGRKIDFKNVVMIMTTNVGAKSIASGAGFGFTKQGDEDVTYDKMKERLLHDVEAAFKPEFIGRLDDVIVFRELNRDNLKRIVDIELSKVRERLGERGFALEMTDSAREFVIDKGSNTEYGARPLRRSVETYIEDPLSEELLRGAFEGHNSILVDAVPLTDGDDEDEKKKAAARLHRPHRRQAGHPRPQARRRRGGRNRRGGGRTRRRRRRCRRRFRPGRRRLRRLTGRHAPHQTDASAKDGAARAPARSPTGSATHGRLTPPPSLTRRVGVRGVGVRQGAAADAPGATAMTSFSAA